MAEAADRYRSAHLYRGKALKFPQPKPFSQSRDKGTIDEIVCHACGKNGHIKPNCPDNPRNFRGKSSFSNDKVNFVFEAELKPNSCVVDSNGFLFYKPVEVMLDTGCSTIIVKDSLVNSKYKLGKMVKVYDYLGRPNYFPKIRCFIKSKFFTGWANAIAAPIKFAEVLIGCVPGVKIPNQSCPDDPSPATTDVATLTSCASPDLCEPPEEPDLCDLPKLPSSCDLTDFPDKPTFPFSTESTQK